MTNTQLTANDLLNIAIKEIDNVKSGTEFYVKELFKGYEWKSYPLEIRLLLGTLFKNHVINNDCSVALDDKKTSRKQQIYKKI